MSENKTLPYKGNVRAFIDGVEMDRRRGDARTLLPLFEKWTGLNPTLLG